MKHMAEKSIKCPHGELEEDCKKFNLICLIENSIWCTVMDILYEDKTQFSVVKCEKGRQEFGVKFEKKVLLNIALICLIENSIWYTVMDILYEDKTQVAVVKCEKGRQEIEVKLEKKSYWK